MNRDCNTSKWKSGALKRKMKREKEMKIEKLPKLDTYFKKPAASEKLPETETELPPTPSPSSSASQLGEPCPVEQHSEAETHEVALSPFIANANANDDNNQIRITSTDLGNFLNKELNDELRRLIISSQSCRPQGPFPRDPKQEGRRFSESYYNIQTKYGAVPRRWLCYSKILDAAYCEPCWLFSCKKNQWCTGVREWKNLSVKVQQHSTTNNHIAACKVYDLWKKNQTIDAELENKLRYETSFWKQVLDRLFNIVLTLTRGSSALRGHREDISQIDQYHGHFLEHVNLLAKYDTIMKQVIEMPKGNTYMTFTFTKVLTLCIY